MKHLLITISLSILFISQGTSQLGYSFAEGCVTDANDDCVPNTILSAVPFLRIIPDARGGAMGDAGIASSADPNALHYNGSKLAFVDKDASFSATYTPWLRNLGLNDIYLTYLTGYKKVDDLSTLGFGLRFFSLGEINFTDFDGNSAGQGKPRELEFSMAYSRKLSENFSVGITGKYIYSNLASGQQVGSITINSANAFAADLSFTYKKKGNMTAAGSELTIGGAISNLGSKITYTGAEVKDFIPANLGIGAGLMLNFDEFNSMTFLFDINKLLVPTPISPTIKDDVTGDVDPNPDYDKPGTLPGADYKEQSMFAAVLSSFGDAQGGFSEELKEFNFSFGVEYWYSKQFAVRTGYYYEHPLKGDRQFITVGAGLKYNVFQIDLSYLVPTNNRRNPLDNTLRFGLQFDFAALTGEDQ